jgi:hypothetical protein
VLTGNSEPIRTTEVSVLGIREEKLVLDLEADVRPRGASRPPPPLVTRGRRGGPFASHADTERGYGL